VAGNRGINSGEFSNQPMYQRRQEIADRFKDRKEGTLFLKRGTGKSRHVPEIAARKHMQQEIDMMLITAPNQAYCVSAKQRLGVQLEK
jgi:hypothetical protein